MEKIEMLQKYEQYSAADNYCLGFVFKKMLYFIFENTLNEKYIKLEKASKKNGGGLKLQLRLKNADMLEFIENGAVCLGSEELLISNQWKNKGVRFEQLVYEMFGQTFRGKDNVPFYMSGDIEINGKQTQVKLNGAQIVEQKTIERLIAR